VSISTIIRPYAREFIQTLSYFTTLGIYTNATSLYCTKMREILDPHHHIKSAIARETQKVDPKIRKDLSKLLNLCKQYNWENSLIVDDMVEAWDEPF